MKWQLMRLYFSSQVGSFSYNIFSRRGKDRLATNCSFSVVGFETSSSTMAYCLHELAKNQELQRRAQQEIDEIMTKYNGQITYETMMEMKFLESCIDGKMTYAQ